MLNEIIKNLGGELDAKLVVLGITKQNSAQAKEIAQTIITRHLIRYTKAYTQDHLIDFFKSGQPLESSELVGRILIAYKSELTSRLRIAEKNADSVSAFVIPFLLSQVSNNINQNPASIKTLLKEKGILSRAVL